jgi:hypothetical protein
MYDVRVTVGKSFLTKRTEAVSAMLEFAKTLPPNLQMLFVDLIVKNSDWPGADELAKRLRNMLPPQALADPDDPNAPKPPGPMDNPEVVAKLGEMAAKVENMHADTRLKDAQADKALTEAGATESDVHLAVHSQLMEDWQGGHPSPGNAPPAGMPPPAPPNGEGPPPLANGGGSLSAQ